MNILDNNTNNPWVYKNHDDKKVFYAGTIKNLEEIINKLDNIDKLKNILSNNYQSYGLIIKSPDLTIAICDRTQSYPIYYNIKTNEISHDIFDITKDILDKSAILEFSCSGYVLGNKTLYKDIYQLQAGEIVFINSNDKIEIHRYYSYIPAPKNIKKTEEEWHNELDDILNSAIKRSIDYAQEHPICVPLSGGLDSRLIIAKLHEHGVKNLYTFSYGLSGNFEAKMAKKVAKQIGVDWFMVPSKPNAAQSLFQSNHRKTYTNYAHGFSRIPSYVEYEALNTIKEKNLIPENCVIINGQSGDYISGGHIPKCLYENDNPSEDDLYRYIIDKHFSLWKNLKTPKNIERLKQLFSEILLPDDPKKSQKDNLISKYESFEWQERQCKMVVNGQKAYDFFGYKWSLPLWDKELMDFFETVPWELKYQQKLFKSYLKNYNYKNIFKYSSATPEIWKLHQCWIIITARIIGLLNSKKAKDDFYQKMSYWGNAHNQYALFGKALYDEHYKDIRNMISLAILDFLNEQDIDFPINNKEKT